MLEYPELYTIAQQMQAALPGKTVTEGALVKPNGNLFMPAEAAQQYGMLQGGTVTHVTLCAPELYVALDNGQGMLFCACGGKILYHENGRLPASHTIHFTFTDGSALSYTMQLWSMGIYAVSHEDWETRKQKQAKTLFQPLEGDFAAFQRFAACDPEQSKTPIKVYLSKHIAGVMSTFAGEILLHAGVYPSMQLQKLDADALRRIYDSMQKVLSSACQQGGRVSETDLLGSKGRYVAMTERKHIGEPCPVCGGALDKNSTGGVTAFCPVCQQK